MAEPRTRPRRPNHNPSSSTQPNTTNATTNATTFLPSDLSDLLYAYSANPPHLPTTTSLLDEILTDFIIETCHLAALSASYSRRQKIKVEDFKFVLRHDERLLGRAMEQIWRDKRIKEDRKVGGMDEGAAGLEGVAKEAGVEEGEMRGGKGKRGRRKRKRAQEDASGEGAAKRVAS